MLGCTPGNIVAIRSLREGVISDYEMTERMITREFIVKVQGIHLFGLSECGHLRCRPSSLRGRSVPSLMQRAQSAFFWS